MDTLEAVPTHKLLNELAQRGFEVCDNVVDVRIAEERDLDQLAELIAIGRTDEALALLHELAPAAPLPATIKMLVAARAAEASTRTVP